MVVVHLVGKGVDREVGREAGREVGWEVGREVGREVGMEVGWEVGREVDRGNFCSCNDTCYKWTDYHSVLLLPNLDNFLSNPCNCFLRR